MTKISGGLQIVFYFFGHSNTINDCALPASRLFVYGKMGNGTAHLFRSFPPPTSLSELNELYRNSPFLGVRLPPPLPPPTTSFPPLFSLSCCRSPNRRLSVNVLSRLAMFCSTSNSIWRSSVDSVGDSGRELNNDGVRFRLSFVEYSMSKSIVICKQSWHVIIRFYRVIPHAQSI